MKRQNTASRSKSNDKKKLNAAASKSKSNSKDKSKSKSKPKVQKAAKKGSQLVEEEKFQQNIGPILYREGDFLSVLNLQQKNNFQVGRVKADYRDGEAKIRFDFYDANPENVQRGARTISYVPLIRNRTEIDQENVLQVLDVKKSQRGKKNDDGIERDVRIANSNIKSSNKILKQKIKGLQVKQKEEKVVAKNQQKLAKEEKKVENNKNNRQIRGEARKRRKLNDGGDDDSEEEKGEQINTDGAPPLDKNKPVVKKREKKAVAKRVVIPKIKEPLVLRDDVIIPDINLKWPVSIDLITDCCQTCANRNCMRAVEINSQELLEKCIISRANVTSLLEHLSPEMRFNALERAISLNRLELIELFLGQEKPENENRIAKKQSQIVKYDTGEVGQMAFGFKIRKVQMMRGNRQGNNAFIEESVHDHQTPIDYLTNNEYCVARIFRQDTVSRQTFEIIKACLDAKRFDDFISKVVPVLMKHGCLQTLLSLFDIIGKDNQPQASFFNNVYFELLHFQNVEDFTITQNDIDQAKLNANVRLSHVAALNPSGAGLKFLLAQNEEIDVYNKSNNQNISLAHYAAVCSTDANLKILIESDIDLHDADTEKRTPLMWTLAAGKPLENVRTVLESLDSQANKDFKDNQKKMAVHYACQYGVSDIAVLELLLNHRAKFSQLGGWDKYTSLIYAATYGNYEAVNYLIENVPRININKGDKYQRSPLLMACRNGHTRIAALLIKHNAKLDQPDSSGNSPLHHAAAYGWLECVQLLIAYGANPNPENSWKFTPITIALQKNHIAIVLELLKNQEVNVNSKDDDGRSLLALSMASINQESVQFVKMLVHEKGAEVNSQDAKGRTPLYHLVHSMSQKKAGLFNDHDDLEYRVVKILLEAGANINIKAKDNKSPFTLAFESGITELVQMFGGSIDLNQDPSLFFAFSRASILKQNVQQLLVDCMKMKPLEDETINHVNDNGFTPLLYHINEFGLVYKQIIAVIEKIIVDNKIEITNETVLEQLALAQQGNPVAAVKFTKRAKEMFLLVIVEPFIKFLTTLIDNGANPNAYVLKLKQYREEFERGQHTPLPSQNQLSQPVAAFARRVPEKEQYLNEEQGLCSVIHLLIQYPQKQLFDYLISIPGIEFNQVNLQKMTPFFKLVKTKDIKNLRKYKYMFEKLLQTNKVDINAPDQFGMSAFWYFYTNNRLEEAFYLVDQGANINHMDNYGFFALKRELFQNNFDLMEKLLAKGANPDQTDEFGRTVLHLACNRIHKGDMKRVITLLGKYRADIGVLDMKRRTPLHYLFIAKNRRAEQSQFEPLDHGLSQLLNPENVNHSFSINQQDTNGKTLLHYAAQRGSIQSLDYFIELFGIDAINFALEDKWLNTPLSVAINCRHFDFVEKLITLGFANLQQFIYEEVKPKNQPQLNNMFGNFNNLNNQQDDEQSDFEFMEVQQLFIPGEDNSNQKHHNKDEALNLFRYIIRNNLNQLEKLFIAHHYDRVQMVIDYICEGQIDNLFKVIDQHFKDAVGAKGSILIQKNKKEQNLIHVLARNGHLIKDIGQVTKFYEQLVQEGVEPKEVDYKGRNALHLAVRSGNIHLIKFLVDVEHFDVNSTDQRGANAIVTLLKGDRILKAKTNILEYLIKKGGNVDQLYQESQYQSSQQQSQEKILEQSVYLSTCVIHAIRHESKDRENIKEVLTALLKQANPSLQDSDGRDAFMYIAIRNHYNTFNFTIHTLKQHQQEELKDGDASNHILAQIVTDHVDKFGKSVVHYVVNPLRYGSYENSKLLKKVIKNGFKWDLKDAEGKTPYDYALLQKSGIMRAAFDAIQVSKDGVAVLPKQEEEDLLMGKQQVLEQQPDKQLEQLLEVKQEERVNQERSNFEKDAHLYLQQIQMQIDPLNYVPCDASGKFNEDCEVMYDGHLEQHFDVYLTRVEIGKFQPGGDYLFYRMQLVLDKSRDLPILLTRWGRIGEEGAFQKTPFSTHDEAIAEFKKVFEQKTSNKWCVQDKFAKKFKKFQRMRTNYVTLDQKNYLAPFDLEHAQLPREATQKELDIMREVCDVSTYLKALQNSGIDLKAMPFSNLNRQNLYDAMEQLQKLQKTLLKLEGLNPRPYGENDRNKLLAMREKMWYLSSRFYEFVPHEEFRNKMVPPISTIDMLMQKSTMIQSLIEIETASKILMAAHYNANFTHPLEYCLQACGVDMQVLPIESAEYQLLLEYAKNTYIDRNNDRKNIKSIIKLTKHSEQALFKSELPNKVLLFHGSKMSNILGILSSGLRVQPMGAQRQGALLGKGIYFTDMLSKAVQYTADKNAPSTGSRFVIVSEVALGNVKEILRFQDNAAVKGEQFDSLQGMGREGPELDKYVTLPDGAKLPIGKHEAHKEGRAASEFQFSEFVVADPTYCRMRYLIQLKGN